MNRSVVQIFIALVSFPIMSPATLAEQPTLQFTTLEGMALETTCTEVLTEAYERMGVNISVIKVPGKRSLIMSSSGRSDGEVMRIKGTEKLYPSLIPTSVPICLMNSRVYTTDASFELQGWQSLSPYSIGIIRGHLYAVTGTLGMNVIEVKDNKTLFKMLELGRIDIAVAQELDAIKVIKNLGLSKIKQQEPLIHSSPLFHYVNEKHRNIIPTLEKILLKMQQEGVMQKIADKNLQQGQ